MATTFTDSPPAELVERVLGLPAEQREELGNLLLDSVESEFKPDDEWSEKIRGRIERYLADPSQAIPGEVVIAEMRAMLAASRGSRP